MNKIKSSQAKKLQPFKSELKNKSKNSKAVQPKLSPGDTNKKKSGVLKKALMPNRACGSAQASSLNKKKDTSASHFGANSHLAPATGVKQLSVSKGVSEKKTVKSSETAVASKPAFVKKELPQQIAKPLDAFDFSESGSSSSPCEPLYILDSFSEATGPRYRKIALNGMPKPDGKPQTKDETDEEKEETYVDSLDLSLRHDTSDIYIPLVGDSLSFAVKRSITAELFTTNPSLPTAEQLNRPFGHGWTSGLTASVQFTYKTPPTPSQCPSERDDPDYTFVTDEAGASFRFLNIWNGAAPAFMPIPTSINEQENFLASLIVLNPTAPQDEWQFQFTKKYGTTLLFSSPIIIQSYLTSPPPNEKFQSYSWGRLLSITDRYGNVLTFNGDDTSLIPTSIETEDGREILITRIIDVDGICRRVSQIQDPLGNIIKYNYNTIEIFGGDTVTQLVSVQRPEGQVIQYGYDYDIVEDNTPRTPPLPAPGVWFYCRYNLSSITDANGNTHTVSYQPDLSMQYFSGIVGWYTPTGVVRVVASATLPNGLSSSFVPNTTDPVHIEYYDPDAPSVAGNRVVVVTDSAGYQRTYTFDIPQLTDSSEFEDLMVPAGGVKTRYYFLIRWQSMQVLHPTGVTESFTFNPAAAMALSGVVDYSGNTDSYEYADEWSAAYLFPETLTLTGNTVLGSSTISSLASTAGLIAGMSISGYGIPYGSTVTAVASSTSITISAPATVTNTGSTFFISYPISILRMATNMTAGSSTLTAISDTSKLVVGMVVAGEGIPFGSTIASVAGSSVTISEAATETNTDMFVSFTYPSWMPSVLLNNPIFYSFYGDPTSQTDALGNTKVFQYEDLPTILRIMTKITDELGRVTSYGINPVNGLRTSETISDPEGTVVKTTLFEYADSTYAAFMTKKTVVDGTTDGDLVTTYVSDTHGYVAQENVGGISLTKYTHDANGNRTSVTDPNNNVTHFGYDGLNRLVLVTNPDSTTKEITYDPAGNKIAEIDENGHVTLYTYDQLNRLIQKERVMGGVLAETGNISASSTITGLATTTGITVGMTAIGRGLPAGATVAGVLSSTSVGLGFPVATTMTGNTGGGVTAVTALPTVTGLAVGMGVSGTGIPSGATIAAIPVPNNIASEADTTTGLTILSSVTSISAGLEVGMVVSGVGIPSGARVVSLGATSTKTGSTTAGSLTVSFAETLGITAGMGVFGTGIPVGATVYAVLSSTEITLSLEATASTVFDSITFMEPQVTITAAATATNSNVPITFVSNIITLSVVATSGAPSTSLTFKRYAIPATGVTIAFATLSSSLDLITQYTYNGVNSKLTETDPNGNVTAYAYDSIQRLIQITDALEQVWLHDFSGPNTGSTAFSSSNFKPTQITDPRGIVTEFVYDKLYRTTSKSVEYQQVTLTGNITTGSNVVTGLSSTAALAMGAGVSGSGIPTGTTVASIVSSSSITLSTSASATATGRSLTFTLFSTMQTAYDPVGNPIEVTDPLGNATQTVFDALNRPTSVLYPNFTATSKTYTPASLVTTETDQAGSVTTHSYDAAGRHTMIYQPDPVTGIKSVNSPLTQMGYDGVGNMTSLINPLGNEWTYVFDVRNRRTEEIQPEVANAEVTGSPMQHPTILTGYDGVGNVTSKTDPRGYVTTMTYDSANRLIETTYPAVPVYGSGSPVAATTLTGHDQNGNVLTVTDEDGNETVNTYDALNRLKTTTTAPVPGTSADNIEEQFAYDPVGNRTQVTDGKGLITAFSYDGLNRLLTTQYDPSTAAATTVTETYNALNKVSRTEGTGRVTQYSYDTLNRLTAVVYVSAPVDNLLYSRDAVGNVLLVVHPNEPGSLRDVVYTYDRLNRHLSENSDGVTQTHTYDKVGNRLTTIYGGTNRLLTYTFDAINRLSSLTDSGS